MILPVYDTAALDTHMQLWNKSGWHIKARVSEHSQPSFKEDIEFKQGSHTWRMLVPMNDSYHFPVDTVYLLPFIGPRLGWGTLGPRIYKKGGLHFQSHTPYILCTSRLLASP